PRVHQAIPQHVHEPDEFPALPARPALPRDHPAEAVPPGQLDPVPFRLVVQPGLERFGVQRIDLFIGERAAPGQGYRHQKILFQLESIAQALCLQANRTRLDSSLTGPPSRSAVSSTSKWTDSASAILSRATASSRIV